MHVLAALAEFDATLPDGQLVALAGAPGVEPGSITSTHRPKRGNHGHHVVSWRQNGRKCSAEGSTLGVALGRALRAAGVVSAPVEVRDADEATP